MPNEDKDIWQAYARGVRRASPKRHSGEGRNPDTSSVKKEHMYFIPEPVKKKTSTVSVGGNAIWLPAFAGMTLKKQTAAVTLDRRTERALRQGAIQIDAKLDLHGMTQVEAYDALDKFMTAQVKRGHRNLLIITGKGSIGVATDRGVLRSNLPQWLETLPAASHILKLCPAAPRHGGSGAFYVILKRRRD